MPLSLYFLYEGIRHVIQDNYPLAHHMFSIDNIIYVIFICYNGCLIVLLVRELGVARRWSSPFRCGRANGEPLLAATPQVPRRWSLPRGHGEATL